MTSAVGTIQSMGWETDAETGAEVFYVHMRFDDIPPLSPKLVWEAIPVTLNVNNAPAECEHQLSSLGAPARS
jgi:hypothetical protein